MTTFPDKNGLDQPTTPLRFLERSARVHPNKVGLVGGPRRVTFVEMAADAQAFAHVLIDDGLQKNDRVSVLAANSYETLLAQFTIPLAGGVVVAINTRLAAKEIEHILEHSEITTLLSKQALIDQALPAVRHLLEQVIYIAGGEGNKPEIADTSAYQAENTATATFSQHLAGDDVVKRGKSRPNLPYSVDDEHDPIAINYISGTTGKPKGVVYTYRGTYLSAPGQIQTMRFNHYTVYLWTLPIFHCSGWCIGWAAMSTSVRQVAIRVVRGPGVWRLIVEEGVTSTYGAPAMLTTPVDDDNKRRVTNLRIMTAGAPPSPAIITRCGNIGVEIAHVYGLTESYGPFTICESQPDWKNMTVRRRAVLKARQGVATITNQDVRIVEQSDAPDAPPIDVSGDGAAIGEIITTGNDVMNGYFKDPEATEHAFRGDWLHTGDLGIIHPDDYIQLLDRAKDVIVSGSENISTIEAEQAVVSYPDASDCVAIGVPDDKWGKRPCAYVALRPEARCQGTTEEVAERGKNVAEVVIAHCRVHIADYRIPRDVVVIDGLPRTSTDKVRKNELRDLAWTSKKMRIKG